MVGDDKRQLLWDLVEGCSMNLSEGERDIFHSLLFKHADVFASSTADLGRTNKVRHHIDTGTAQPIRQAVRRISPHCREEVRALLEQMLAKGVVEPSSSPWASPVVLAHQERCKPPAANRCHSRYPPRFSLVHDLGPAQWLLAGRGRGSRQGKDRFLHPRGPLSVPSHAVRAV